MFDVTQDTPKQIARLPVGKGPYWNVVSRDGQTVYVACPGSDEVIVFDVATRKEKTRLKFTEGDRPIRMLIVDAPVRATSTASR